MKNDSSKFKMELKKRSYVFGLNIIRFVDSLNKHDFSVQILSKQLLRSATSVGANIIEAQAASSKKDFTNFFNYSLKSANETKFWLGLLKDSNKADQIQSDKLLRESIEISNILGSSILTLRGKR